MRSAPGARSDAGHDSPVTVAVSGVEFGWGSSGKLSAVLAALRQRTSAPLRFVGLASGIGRTVLAGHAVERWYDLPTSPGEVPRAVRDIVRSQGVRAAVVVLDGDVAKALESAGIPTVFVDSLPFLWTGADRAALPLEVSVYCAQRCVDLPDESRKVLEDVRTLRWVEAVIDDGAAGARRPAGEGVPYRRALVSLGGLRAPRLADWTVYPRVVLPAALAALASYGVREAHVAGNLPAGPVAQLVAERPVPLHVTAGPLVHGEFLGMLAGCDVLVASPGLTTLLEAGGMGVPTVCLPPQNLSQIFNGRFHSRAVGAAVRVTWPADVFREDQVLAMRALGGEDSALELIYGGIARSAGEARGPRTSAALGSRLLTALRRSEAGADWGALTSAVGTGGAAQVAGELLGILRRASLPA